MEGYVTGAGGYFSQHGFFESPIVSRVQTFGNVAQVFCSYESRGAAGEAPFARGINSIQLAYDGKRWWVVSILWDEERPDNPLPKEPPARPWVQSSSRGNPSFFLLFALVAPASLPASFFSAALWHQPNPSLPTVRRKSSELGKANPNARYLLHRAAMSTSYTRSP